MICQIDLLTEMQLDVNRRKVRKSRVMTLTQHGPLQLCCCGCGKPVRCVEHCFISGHQNRGKNNPMFGKNHSEKSNKRNSKSHKGNVSSDETKLKLSKSFSGKNNPNFGKKMTDEQKLKISETLKGRKHTEEHKRKNREANLGEKNHSWRGGISFEPYCHKFTSEFKERVRDFFDGKCFVCGRKNKNRKLSVHHVNYDKMVCCNDVKPLFVALCTSCHIKTNFNREYWEEKLTQQLMSKYGDKCYLPA